MTSAQHDEYMDNVKWKTMLFYAFTCGSVLLGMAGMFYGLKGDIKESVYASTWHYLKLDKKMDSLHQVDQTQIQSLKDDIKTNTFSGNQYEFKPTYAVINGKKTLIFLPAK